jgi:hypothetical protein
MKKTLITEINRIQELMGKPLITEQKLITKVIDDLAVFLAKNFSKVDIKLKTLIDRLKLKTTSNDVKLNILAQLSRMNKSMADVIIPRVMNTLPQEVKDQITKFKDEIPKFIKDQEDLGYSVTSIDKGVDNFLDTKLGGLNDDIRFIIKKDVTDYADKFLKDSPTPVVNPKIPVRQTSIQGQFIRFKDVLNSYRPILKNIEQKILDDIEQYKKFKGEALRAPDLSSTQINANKNAKRFLDRIDFNLGLANRKNKELSDTLIESLNDIVRKNTNEKNVVNSDGQLAKQILDGLKNKDTKIRLSDYFKSTDPEKTLWKETEELMNRRSEQLKTMFSIPKFSNFGKWSSQTARLLTGDIINLGKRIWKDPKKIPRILATETGARLFNYTFKLAVFETIYDSIWYASTDKEWVEKMTKEHPNVAKWVAFTGPDYKNYNQNFLATGLSNLLINWVEKMGLTIPALYIYDWLKENFKSGGLPAYYDKQRDRLIEIETLNLSPEEKQKEIDKITNETNSLFEDFIESIAENPNLETVEGTINKELAALEKPTVFTNDEKGFKDWCKANQKSFKSYNSGFGKTTDGQVWEFKNGTFQLFI